MFSCLYSIDKQLVANTEHFQNTLTDVRQTLEQGVRMVRRNQEKQGTYQNKPAFPNLLIQIHPLIRPLLLSPLSGLNSEVPLFMYAITAHI